jgi:hypothetical protein
MIRVIKAGGTARVMLEGQAPGRADLGSLVAGLQRCADSGVQELLIAVPEAEDGWLEILEEALVDAPSPLRIWVSLGDPDPYRPLINRQVVSLQAR